MFSSICLMTDKNSEASPDSKLRIIVLTEDEVSEISKLYETALKLSDTSIDSRNQMTDQKSTDISLNDSKSSPTVIQRKKAWHEVQEYLEKLGKKYNYDPEKFVINKITRELEPYRPGM